MAGSDSTTILRMPSDKKSRLSLMDKWRNHYHGRGQDEETTRMTNVSMAAFFWFISLTEVYCGLCYVIPFSFGQYGEMFVYYMKVGTCFVFINAAGNWLCVVLYRTTLEHTLDRPGIKNLLWEDHPSDSQIIPMENGCHRNGVGQANGHIPAADPLRWRRCHVCNLDQPPRTHHCKICQKCVLKRDHHCYMTGTCIGFYNERYFVILNFYTAVACLAGLPFIWNYMYYTFLPNSTSWLDFVLPVTVYRWFWGEYHIRYVFMMCHLYCLWWIGLLTAGFFVWEMYVITQGKTSHEIRTRVPIRCTAKIAENFQNVFGAFWGLNFVFPANIVFRQTGDGKIWENLKVDSASHAKSRHQLKKLGHVTL